MGIIPESGIAVYKTKLADLRAIPTNGEWWTFLDDVCAMVGDNPEKAKKRVSEQNQRMETLMVGDSFQEADLINSEGFIQLMITSQSPLADRIGDWLVQVAIGQAIPAEDYIGKPGRPNLAWLLELMADSPWDQLPEEQRIRKFPI